MVKRLLSCETDPIKIRFFTYKTIVCTLIFLYFPNYTRLKKLHYEILTIIFFAVINLMTIISCRISINCSSDIFPFRKKMSSLFRCFQSISKLIRYCTEIMTLYTVLFISINMTYREAHISTVSSK